MSEVDWAVAWLIDRYRRARTGGKHGGTHGDGHGGEHGASAVEWLLIIIAAVGICAVIAVAVRTYVNGQTGKLNN